jgi:hypothetical protein
MHNPHASGIGLDARGGAVDAGRHVVVQSHDGSRLPGPFSAHLQFPPDPAIPENFSLHHINSFSEQAIRAAHQNARDVCIVSDLPQAGGGHHIVACQESSRMQHQSFVHPQFRGLDICPQPL